MASVNCEDNIFLVSRQGIDVQLLGNIPSTPPSRSFVTAPSMSRGSLFVAFVAIKVKESSLITIVDAASLS